MSRELRVSEEYLSEVMKYQSSALVGKVMKRFEILDGTKALKASVKELIYESFRDLSKILEAHSMGMDMGQFHFKRPS